MNSIRHLAARAFVVVLLIIGASDAIAADRICPEGQTVAGRVRNWGGYFPAIHQPYCTHGRLIYPNKEVIHAACFAFNHTTHGSNDVVYSYSLRPYQSPHNGDLPKDCTDVAGCAVEGRYDLTANDNGHIVFDANNNGDYVNIDTVCVNEADAPQPGDIPDPDPPDPSDPNCIGQGCDSWEGDQGQFRGPGKAGKTYAASLEDFYTRVEQSPLLAALADIAPTAGGSSNCPVMGFTVMNVAVESDLHCTLTYDMPLLPAMFIGIYALWAVLIVFSA